MKKNLNKLFNEIEKEVGTRYCWFGEEHNNQVDIQVIDDAEDDVRDLIVENGFEIEDESWFSGSDYDGYTFTIKVN